MPKTGNCRRPHAAYAGLRAPAAGQSMPVRCRLDAGGKQVLSVGGRSALQDKQGDYVIAYALS